MTKINQHQEEKYVSKGTIVLRVISHNQNKQKKPLIKMVGFIVEILVQF